MSNHYSINLNPDGIVATVVRRIYPLIERVEFGMTATNESDGNGAVPHTFGCLQIPERERRSRVDVMQEFRTWILTAAFREAIEVVAVALEEARLVAAVVACSNQATLTGAQMNDVMNSKARRFHRLGLPDKLDALAQLDVRIDSNMCAELLSINVARNCLVHRLGRVRPPDLNEDGHLVVRYRRLGIVVRGNLGEREFFGPAEIAAGESVSMRIGAQERRFPLGSCVEIGAQEYSDICITLVVFAQELKRALFDLIQRVGIPAQALMIA